MRNARLSLLLATALLAMSATAAPARAQSTEVLNSDRARIRGADGARVWLVIVGEFTSQGNREFRRSVWPLVDSLFVRPGRLRVAWVNLPGESRASQDAAEVAACAGGRFKFWAAHDIFLDQPFRWEREANPTPILVDLALSRGADPIWLKECLSRHLMRGLLQGDVARARGAGVRAAPAFILDNKVLANVRTAAEFRAAIEAAVGRTK